jgi:NSS family neurotransmitter:Na+ symporter
VPILRLKQDLQQNWNMSIAVRSTVGVWGSRTTFVLALSASAIGFGNLWRFAYLMGERGGAPFLLAYLVSLFLVAVPVLIAEVLVGSHGRASPIGSLLYTANRSEISRLWAVIGWFAGIAAILLLACYSVVAGWGLAYLDKLQSGVFSDASAADIGRDFQALLANPQELVKWQSLFLLATFLLSGLGIYRGVAVLFWIAVPLLLAALGVLIDFALQHGDLERAGTFLFSVSVYDFTAESVLIAMAQAFYTLGVGLCVGMAFGAYAPEKMPIGRAVIAVALFDTLIAIAAGVAIFAIVFANNLQPGMGPALVFVGLPYAFGNMPQGEFFGGIFFLMLTAVAVASAVAIAEPVMAYLVDRLRTPRPLAAVLLGSLIWLLALACAMSFTPWQGRQYMGDLTVFQLFELIASALLLPLVSLLTALLVGYRVRREILRVELYRESPHFVYLWRACLRYIAPPVIIVLMLATLVEIL